MSTIENINSIEPGHPDWDTKLMLFNRLDDEISRVWRTSMEAVAKAYASELPLDAHAEKRWVCSLKSVGGDIYQEMVPEVNKALARMFREHELHLRPDAEAWRKWIIEKAEEAVSFHTRFSWVEFADYMAEVLAARYCVRFSCWSGYSRALFVVAYGDNLGEGWEVLSDTHVSGENTDDHGYIRVVYAYNATRHLLLCLHRRYITLPHGERSLEWVLSAEWWETSHEEALTIVANASMRA